MTTTFATDFEAFAANGGAAGPSWLLPMRREAFERFLAEGIPTPRNEDWKFTNVTPLADRPVRIAGEGRALQPRDLRPFEFAGETWSELVFLNGRFQASLSRVGTLPEGVILTSMAEALAKHPDLVHQHLGGESHDGSIAFTALNTAFMQDGTFLYMPRNTVLPGPVHLLFLTDPVEEDGSTHPRNLLVTDEGAEGYVVESYAALGDGNYFTNAMTEVRVGPNAFLGHCKVQRESEEAWHVGTCEVRQARDSRFRSFSCALGGKVSRTNIYSVMDGTGALCTMNGLYMGHGDQHIDHQTRIEHAQPSCASREVYKGVLDGSSHGVFNGKVYVRPEAQQTDGKQTNKNLLLSEKARVDTKPQLEIFADDVRCTHGATVGTLDELSLFYMESRGIADRMARKMLTYGFAADVLAEVQVPDVRQRLEQLVFRRLDEAGEAAA